MIISVLVTWIIVDCNLTVRASFIILLVVRYRSIQSKTTDFWLAFVDTSKTLSLAQVK